MNRLLLAAALFLTSASTLAADVNVSIRLGGPDFYGPLVLRDLPPPVLVDRRPIIVVQPPPAAAAPAPLYLRVPPGHAKHWSKHCNRYQACNRPVYFVQDSWYRDVYAPAYREHGGRPDRDDDDDDDHGGKHKKDKKHKDKGEKKHKKEH